MGRMAPCNEEYKAAPHSFGTGEFQTVTLGIKWLGQMLPSILMEKTIKKNVFNSEHSREGTPLKKLVNLANDVATAGNVEHQMADVVEM